MREFAIVGGGIGGCSVAALLHARGHDVVLIEKEPSLGGCASTFTRKGHRYNAGATTIAGYHRGGVLRRLCDTIGVELDVIPTDPAVTIVQEGKRCVRYRDLEKFLDEIHRFYPHPRHAEFWTLVRTIGTAFEEMEGYGYSNASLFSKLRSLAGFFPVLKTFWPYLHANARRFIQDFYGGADREYLDFLDAQILIVAQATSDRVNFFTAALALGYTFNEIHYPLGGMGAVCERIVSRLPDVRRGCEVRSVEKTNAGYRLVTSAGTISARNLIMGTSHYESSGLFRDPEILSYYRRYETLDNHQSAFVLYLRFRSEHIYDHHYQLISPKILPHTLSQSVFVSLSDPADTAMAPRGEYCLTASIHTDAREWIGAEPSRYKAQKEELQALLQSMICDTLSLSGDAVIESFSATPKTFRRYLNRTQVGGNAMTCANILPLLPSNDTPIKGFYQVGDTAYAAQGWPGVVIGAINCARLIDG